MQKNEEGKNFTSTPINWKGRILEKTDTNVEK